MHLLQMFIAALMGFWGFGVLGLFSTNRLDSCRGDAEGEGANRGFRKKPDSVESRDRSMVANAPEKQSKSLK